MSRVPENVLDVELWKQAKKQANLIYSKPSAYKSGFIVSYYKNHGGKFRNKKSATSVGLKRWFKEKWVNQHGKVGYEHKNDVYRPSKRITASTPTTWSELSASQIKKASREKAKTGRVKRFNKA
jgi:hypothetical protein